MRNLLIPTALFFCLPASLAVAHPHIFVQVEVSVIFTDGQPTDVQLNWLYDDYFSLLLTSDLGIDLDGDLELTDDEVAILAGSVTQWPEDFDGDLFVTQGDTTIGLGPKYDHRMIFDAGLVVETHTRPITGQIDPAVPFNVQVYDPFYYVAYEVAGAIQTTGRDDCDATITPPDLNKAYSLVEELLYGRPASDVGPDEEFPEIGVEFAEVITVTCAG